MNVKQLYRTIRDLFSETRWVKLTYEIFNLEKNFNYSDFEKSAKLCREELKNSKVKNVEIIELKADGKTVYGDFIMPESFDWEYAYLKITHPIEFKDYILADTKIHPFCIANRSAPTKEKLFEIIHINDINKKKNLKNYLVFCDNIHPSICRESIESTNAEGIISSYSGAPEYKDCMYWINGWSRRSGWYQTKDEKKLICFSISPSKGELLKKLIEKGSVKVCACVKSKIYNGKINLITGNIPGKRKKEITFLAHLYEPMINDNASGVSGLIEVANLINTMIENYGFTPEYGIRFLFGMEMYGFENFFEKKHSIIYGINVDCITCDIQKTGTKYITVYESHFTNPFFGDWIFEDLLERFFCFPWRKRRTPYHDNTFISDLSIGIPVLYIISSPGKFHHNSYDSEIVNWAQGKEILFLLTTYCCLLSSGKLSNYLEQIEFWAKKEFFSYLCKLQNFNETTKYHLENRVLFFSEYLKKKYCSLELFDVKPCRKFLKEIDEISEKTLKK
ncbi:MAG: hypothetical protein NZ891_05800, partial [bacterium]|nr:hypothetical protein [bacterium]MDW8164238.1 hypothetical protein [Candidatus Omnitrophota bacterium]